MFGVTRAGTRSFVEASPFEAHIAYLHPTTLRHLLRHHQTGARNAH